MTISDTELEAGLRSLRARADEIPPPPSDLARRTRERYRAQRRSRAALAAGGLVALVVLVGVPVAASTILTGEGQTATPSGHTSTPATRTGLYGLPTRGDLADDEEWLAAVTALDWGPVDTSLLPAGMEVPDPSVGSRRVAFAGDVASGRVALVLGMDGRNLGFAWFLGPEDAEPDEMALATMPGVVGADGFLGLVDAPSPDALEQSLIVVATPGDTMTWKGPSIVSASGEVDEQTVPLDLDDGIGTHEVSVPFTWDVDVRGPGNQRRGGSLTDSDRSRPGGSAQGIPADVAIADPRGLATMTVRDNAAYIARSVLDEYALGAADAQPTLLAAGPLGVRGDMFGELYGLTHLSGATEVWLTTYVPSRPDSGFQISRFPPAPVGQALMDRVIAVSAESCLLVSAPEGVQAQVLDRAGVVLTTIPLTQGAGAGPMNDPNASKVRVLDAAGSVVGEGPVTRAGE
ncbi:hypothetical protein [Blastococcus sp. CT_GayMR16]|uniref:hypothetical protein n=1 Tax=Blastococcus sp. CT_GayMR16 TaxID=2559607 RepID=UPI0010741270|nr:hypothetical protein [Blastococcus sp. CT_GayMR16]TFV87936.1 hypothetical protein E4P38_11665 [Blastococcus sp. CT_GayMR16]